MAVGVHVSAANTSGATLLTSGNVTTTSGSTVIVFGLISGDTFDGTTPIEDSKANTWTLIGSEVHAGGRVRAYKAVNITGGASHNFTIRSSSAGNFLNIQVCEVTGVPTAPTVLGTGANDVSSPYDSGSIAPGTACTIVGAFFSQATGGTETDTWGGSFSSGDQIEAIGDADNRLPGSMAAVDKAAGTYNSSVTQSGGTGTNPVAFIVSVETSGGAAAYNAVPLLQYYQSLKRGGIFH